jgi:hypothetical protein
MSLDFSEITTNKYQLINMLNRTQVKCELWYVYAL